MANEDFTSTEKTIEISDDSFNEAVILLDRAHGVLDAIYTLENSVGNSTEGLCKGSLSAVLDTAMMSITQARELLVSSGALK